jgi:ribosomal protein S27E
MGRKAIHTDYIILPCGQRRKAKLVQCKNCHNTKLIQFSQRQTSFLCDQCREAQNYVDVTCAHCGTTFKRLRTHVNSLFVFCDRQCKEAEQRLGGLLELDHYSINNNYRKIAFAYYGKKCKLCEITDGYLLAVHHIDGDRENNIIDNLEVLCHNHHAERHKKFSDGEWVLDFKFNGLD